MIGPFFYIVSKNFTGFICNKIKEETAEKYGNFLVDPKSHADLFDEKFTKSRAEYFEFPRGRVSFNIEKNIHVIILDKCLVEKSSEIADLFELDKYEIDFDEHYVCYKCKIKKKRGIKCENER
jgi:hypothetical protein